MIRFLLVAALTVSAAAVESPLFTAYSRFQKALAKEDVEQTMGFLAKAKVEHLATMNESEVLSSLRVVEPKKGLRMHKEILDGDDATLVVIAEVYDNESVGRVQMLRESGEWRILSELWDIGGDPEIAPGDPVIQPKNDEQRAALRLLRARGFPNPSADFLVMTAGSGDLDAVKLFVQAGYSVDTKDRDTPAIVSAASSGHQAVVRYLMDAGADVNAKDAANTTALMRLVEKCDATPTILALIKAGAQTDGKTAGGATTAQLAEWASCEENLKAIAK